MEHTEIKKLLSTFLSSNDTTRFTIEGIDYYFHQEENLCVVEKLTRDVYLKLLNLLSSYNFKVLYVSAYNKNLDAVSNSNMNVFYSVTFSIKS